MKTRTFTITTLAAVLATLLTFSGSGLTAPGNGNGNGGGDGGSGEPPQDFGDLVILYRNTSGVPILDGELCQQPIAFDPLTCGDAPIPVDEISGEFLVPVDPATCAVEAAYAGCTQEVDFGRVNVSRAPASVFEQQLADVVVNLATSDCVVSLDPAGRMVTSAGTIDSPLQNLAIYRQLMLTGSIGVSLPQDATVLDTAARGLGVASDKTGEVNVDLVAYLNQIMGLSDPATTTILEKICIDVKEEVQGTVQLVQKCYLDYVDYAYTRSDNFSTIQDSLPSPAYIPAGSPANGSFEYLAVLDVNMPSFQILQGPILDAVFCVDPDPVTGSCNGGPIDPGFLTGNIGGFAQASDDTRAVINFMHDWAIPDADVFATPVPCVDVGDTAYDVSISDVSGLQVPKNYVNGQEREFTVTVANAGPDPASGTVTVTASANDTDEEWVETFNNLAAGTSESFVQPFTITTTSDTIDWTAVVEAEFDVLEGNNTATATSTVKASGGGGGNGNKP